MKTWLRAASIRAAKTGAQTALALIGTGAVGIAAVAWPVVLSGTALAVLLSLLTSVKGLPEVTE